MRLLLYFLLALAATSAGSMTGMGGGVIMKPLLDLFSGYDAVTIGMLSSATVFTMAIVSVTGQMRRGAAVDAKIAISLAMGSLLGGTAGQQALALFHAAAPDSIVVTQNICLAAIILCVLAYLRLPRRPTLGLAGILPGIFTGMLLGALSSFLGIGGGPFNVAIIILVYNCSLKSAALYSVVTILFSQGAKLVTALFSGSLLGCDFSVLPVMAAGAILGGWAGSALSRRLSEKAVQRMFVCVQVFVLFICMYNIYRQS